MLRIIVAAVLGAAVGALTTASLKWGRSALAAVMARIRRDHRTLYGGRAWALPQSVSAGAPCSVRILVACAPSRAIRKQEIDPDRAWLNTATPSTRSWPSQTGYAPEAAVSRRGPAIMLFWRAAHFRSEHSAEWLTVRTPYRIMSGCRSVRLGLLR
jgi:hypothetical protein